MSKSPRVAYLTTTYPSVSHTFIRRELLELERQLGDVARIAVRHTPYRIVDPEDARENEKTVRLLDQPVQSWFSALTKRGVARPLSALRGLRKAISLGKNSSRGLAVHAVYWLEALMLLEELDQRHIDHLHVHFGTNPAAVAQIARAMGGPPYSFTVHGPDEFDAPVGLSLGPKIEDSAFVVAISEYGGAQLRRWVSSRHWDKIRVVHCTVGDDFFESAVPLDTTSKRLVCVGRLSPQKGQVLLVQAFADAIERGVDAELVLAGDGEMRAEIEAIAAQRGLGSKLRITGWLSGRQVREELLAARALVLPSFAEGLPVVIMEAFALGRPVLTTHIAGIPELVVDGENGWLIPAGSRAATTEGIVKVMSTPPEELERMGMAGRRAVSERHRTQTETRRLADAIRDVFQGASSRA